MPRLQPLEPPFEAGLAEELTAMMPPGVPPLRLFRTLAHNPRVLRKIRLGNLLDRGSLDRRDREIVILRTTARCGAEYEWGVHVAFFAERVKLTRAQVAATLTPGIDPSLWSAREQALLRAVDQLHEGATLDDKAWTALASELAPDQVVEVLVLAGFYHTISFVVNALGVEAEAGAPRFPEAGA
jgi:alkylhydroperoxidase family enzyme